MKTVLTLAAALVTLSACTTVHDPGDWSKAAASVQQITFDDMECERQSRDIPGTVDLIVGGLVDIPRIAIENGQREHIYTRCMNDRGYEKKGEAARVS
jgi:hypothetical protein